ncbi:MAG: MFS transporter [Pyrinomonadaceae bacterium]
MKSAEIAMQKLPDTKIIIGFIYFGFFVTGVVTVLLGQVLPIISVRLALSDAHAGYLFIAQFAASTLGVLTFNRLIRRNGFSATLSLGMILVALAVLGLNADSFFVCLVSVVVYGFGLGISIPTTNMFIVDISGKTAASALNGVNIFWGLGAIFSKPIVDITSSQNSIKLTTALISGSMLICAVFFLSNGFRKNDRSQIQTAFKKRIIWRSPAAWSLAAFNFVNMGIESSVGGWLTTYEDRMIKQSNLFSAALLFFGFMVFGRFIGALATKHFSENRLLFINIVILAAGIAIICFYPFGIFFYFGSALAGFGTSSIFPTNLARFTSIFGGSHTVNLTPYFVAGSAGGAITTWLVGFTSTNTGNLRNGFFLVLIFVLLLFMMQTIISRSLSNHGGTAND